jgi:RNA polymerase sigma-70 factor, ECF subfamily
MTPVPVSAPMTADPPDAASLLARVAVGDEEALRGLYDAFRPRLRRYLWHQLDGDAAAVDDALQDIFVAVWRTAAGYRGEASVATWLFQIARYRALHARRGRRGAGAPLSLDRPEQERGIAADREALSPEEQVLGRLTLARALAALSPKHREALYLVSQQGFSLEEAAAILGVPVGTVKSRMSYARKALLAALAGESAEGRRRDG